LPTPPLHARSKKQKLVDALLPASEFPRPAFLAADLAAVPLVDALAAAPSFDFAKPTLFTMEGLVGPGSGSGCGVAKVRGLLGLLAQSRGSGVGTGGCPRVATH
jgi:hypothetical protein